MNDKVGGCRCQKREMISDGSSLLIRDPQRKSEAEEEKREWTEVVNDWTWVKLKLTFEDRSQLNRTDPRDWQIDQVINSNARPINT